MIPQSFANFANVFPSISFAPAENYAKTSFSDPDIPVDTAYYFGDFAGLDFLAGAFFSSSICTPDTF